MKALKSSERIELHRLRRRDKLRERRARKSEVKAERAWQAEQARKERLQVATQILAAMSANPQAPLESGLLQRREGGAAFSLERVALERADELLSLAGKKKRGRK